MITEQQLQEMEHRLTLDVIQRHDLVDLIAEVRRLQQHIDRAWFGIERGFDIEPREFFEKDAPRNGFKWPLEQAMHHVWKRDPKVQALIEERDAALAERDALRDAICPNWQEKGLADKLAGVARAFRSDSETMDEIGEGFDVSYRTAVSERDHERLRYDGMRSDRDDWRKRCEDAQAAHELEKTCRERNWNDLKWVRQALDNECRYSEQRNAALAEARRVLRDINDVLDSECPQLREMQAKGLPVSSLGSRIAAVLAQEEK